MLGFITKFLPSIGPAASALLNPWILLGAIAVISGAFLAGMHEQTIRFEAHAKQAQDAAIADAVVERKRQREENAALAELLNQERSDRDDDQREFEERLAAASVASLTDVNCPAGNAQNPVNAVAPADGKAGNDGGSCRLSISGVRLWNAALALGVDDAHRGQWADAANTGAGPVEINAAIHNVDENAAILGECRDRELAWQVKACQNKWWIGPPCDERMKEFSERTN